jgi:thioredoxin-like negative regulator of GroEL
VTTEQDQNSGDEHLAVPTASAEGAGDSVSTFRIVRLAVLLAVLIAICAVALWQRVRSSRRQAARRREAALRVEEARARLTALNLAGASNSLQAAYELDPANSDIATLLVPLLFAGGDLEGALDRFHSLGLGDSARIDGVLSEYVRWTSVTWAVAHRVTADGETDVDRALLLCRWFAHYLLPTAADAVPAEPIMVLWRGHGSPGQLAWAYAELARQAGLSCQVVLFPQSPEPPRPVRVSPAEAQPFLVDPSRGIRVQDPEMEAAVRQAAPPDPSSTTDAIPDETQMHEAVEPAGSAPGAQGLTPAVTTAQSHPDGGQATAAAPGVLSSPLLAVAAHPASLDARLLALEELLADLPDHPKLYLHAPAGGRAEPLQVWLAPGQILAARRDPRNAARVAEESQRMSLVRTARKEAMVGNYGRAGAEYDRCAETLGQALDKADVAETARLIAGSLEDVRFYAAANAHEAGDFEEAATRLAQYADQYPRGTWTVLVQVLRADVAFRRGDVDEACRLWSALPEPRKAYGAARIDELRQAQAVSPSDGAPALQAPAPL